MSQKQQVPAEPEPKLLAELGLTNAKAHHDAYSPHSPLTPAPAPPRLSGSLV
eukprot:gene4421-4675_t